ncbi:MAG: hypothetical protein ACFFAQ_16555 [Promethearchaeota archaeon]
MRLNDGNLYHKITLILVSLLLISIIIPFATPDDQGVDSKEALSFVWIWGLCYGQGEFFYLLNPFGIIYFLFIFLFSLVILTLANSLFLNNNKINLGKFGEHVFIYSFLIILTSIILMEFIEYNFLFFPDVPYVFGSIRADFWAYHNPGFGYYGIFIVSFILLFAGLVSMHRVNSNFFPFAIFLSIVLVSVFLYFGLMFYIFPI